jgi:hypothetical protein
MGLDISYHSRLVLAENVTRDKDGFVDDPAILDLVSYVTFTEESWPGRTEGLAAACYRLADSAGGGFRAGSYGGYNLWRDQLAQIAGWASADEAFVADGGPFWELINFPDNEGVIGPVVSAKLAKDFADEANKARALVLFGEDAWFLEKYRDWAKAFATAADGGCVLFH